MAKPPECSVKIRAGRDHNRRAVAFLDYEQVRYVDIHEAFKKLSVNEKKYFNTSFDYWIGGMDSKIDRYHGWNKNEFGGRYQECFVFKNPPHRLYGFLCHPKTPEDGRFLMCVLILHAEKRKWKTDETELKRAETMRTNTEVQGALRRIDWTDELKPL